MIKERSQMGLRARVSEGRWPNGDPPPWLRTPEDGHLEVKSDDADLVRRIIAQYLEVRSVPQVAHEPNKQGIITKNGNEWTAHAVGDILTNRVYSGKHSTAGIEGKYEDCRTISDETFRNVT